MRIGGAEYISYQEAAALCGCGRTRLQGAVSSGRIAAARPGRYKMLRLADVEAWMQAQVIGGNRRARR